MLLTIPVLETTDPALRALDQKHIFQLILAVASKLKLDDEIYETCKY